MKKLTRSRDDKWIGGVCGGVAEYTGVDTNIVRLVLAILTVLGAGSLIIVYVLAWILMPKRDRYPTVRAQPTGAPTTGHAPPPPSA